MLCNNPMFLTGLVAMVGTGDDFSFAFSWQAPGGSVSVLGGLLVSLPTFWVLPPVYSVAVWRRIVVWTEEPLLCTLPTYRTKCLLAQSSSRSSLLGCKLCRKWLCPSHCGRGWLELLLICVTMGLGPRHSPLFVSLPNLSFQSSPPIYPLCLPSLPILSPV